MSVTAEQIKALTPQHRIVWHEPPGQPVELGLYVEDEDGFLCTDVGHLVRYQDGSVATLARSRIVKIIDPPFTPKRGMVIGHPNDTSDRLVFLDDVEGISVTWLGRATEISGSRNWFTTDQARDLISNHGWVVVGDLSKP